MTDKASPGTETHREVGRRRIAAGEARTALIRWRCDAPVEDVWDACTNPDRLNRWFLEVTGDLRVGGTFILAGNATGDILRCQPPHLLTVTWAYGDRPVDEVELRLSPGKHGDTILELEHASVSDLAPDGSTSAVLGVGVGWEMALDYLGKFLRREFPSTPGQEATQQDFEPTPKDMELVNLRGRIWAAQVEAAATARRPDTASTQNSPRAMNICPCPTCASSSALQADREPASHDDHRSPPWSACRPARSTCRLSSAGSAPLDTQSAARRLTAVPAHGWRACCVRGHGQLPPGRLGVADQLRGADDGGVHHR